MSGRVRIEVGGQVLTISRDLLENGPRSRLQDMYRSASASDETCVVTVERPHEMFAAILAMYQTGELHIPMTSCPGAFINELAFWEISEATLSPCCYNRMQSFHDEQQTLKQFRDSLEEEAYLKVPNSSQNTLQTTRFKLWNLVEYRNHSISARLYFILALLMVMLSIFILAVKTDSNFQRNMTNCERLEYMESSGMEDVELIKETFQKHCGEENLPDLPKQIRRRKMFNGTLSKEFNLFYHIFTDSGREIRLDKSSTIHKNNTQTVIGNASVLALTAHSTRGKYIKVPNMKVARYTLSVLEIITLVFFTVDLVLRLISSPSLKQYFFCIINITDALALVCTYIHLIVLYIYKHKRYTVGWTNMLEFSQMLRALRLFRIVSSIRAGKVLAYTLRANLKDLSIICIFLISGMCAFASCFYIAEDKKNVSSILTGWYWAVVTMTTVGYGDISPKSPIGRFIACLCAMSGVLLFALALPIFTNNFVTLYQHSDGKEGLKEYHTNSLKVSNDSLETGKCEHTKKHLGKGDKSDHSF